MDLNPEPLDLKPGAYPDFYTGVVDMLRHGAPPPVDPADAVTTLTVLEADRRSARRHPRDCPMTAELIAGSI
jgi:scyllo-inositol 2-dehydrogenase (NADP+)